MQHAEGGVTDPTEYTYVHMYVYNLVRHHRLSQLTQVHMSGCVNKQISAIML